MIVQMLTTESIHFDTSIQTRKSYDLVWLYTNKTAELEDFLKKSRRIIASNGMIWVSWHKKASKKPTEINEDMIRATALALDLVDVKVASVDDTWSALKMVIPIKQIGPIKSTWELLSIFGPSWTIILLHWSG